MSEYDNECEKQWRMEHGRRVFEFELNDLEWFSKGALMRSFLQHFEIERNSSKVKLFESILGQQML